MQSSSKLLDPLVNMRAHTRCYKHNIRAILMRDERGAKKMSEKIRVQKDTEKKNIIIIHHHLQQQQQEQDDDDDENYLNYLFNKVLCEK